MRYTPILVLLSVALFATLIGASGTNIPVDTATNEASSTGKGPGTNTGGIWGALDKLATLTTIGALITGLVATIVSNVSGTTKESDEENPQNEAIKSTPKEPKSKMVLDTCLGVLMVCLVFLLFRQRLVLVAVIGVGVGVMGSIMAAVAYFTDDKANDVLVAGTNGAAVGAVAKQAENNKTTTDNKIGKAEADDKTTTGKPKKGGQ